MTLAAGEIHWRHRANIRAPRLPLGIRLFLCGFAPAFGPVVFLLELLDPAGGIDVFHLAGEERVRGGRDFHLNQGIRLAVFPLDRFLGSDRGAGEELNARRGVQEDDGVVIGMNVFFHFL